MSWLSRVIQSITKPLKPEVSSATTTIIEPPDSKIDAFWSYIETTIASPDQVSALGVELEQLNKGDLIAFAADYQRVLDQAYHWDLWGAAYVINGGCSDDGFDYFCDWLISRGRSAYEAALATPDALVDTLVAGQAKPFEVDFEDFRYVVYQVFLEKFGSEMPDFSMPSRENPTGTPFQEDEDSLAERYPRLTVWAGHASN